MQIQDARSRLKLDVEDAKRLLLDADAQEILGIISLWNMIAPGMKHRIDPRRPERIGQKEGFRLNALMHAIRNTRAQSAIFAAQKCLEIVKDSASMTEACKRIAAAIEGNAYEATTDPEEHELVENQ